MHTIALDETKEKKDLRLAISTIEKQIMAVMKNIEKTRKDLQVFSDMYDEKISGLQKIMIDLDRVLEKYTVISSHVDEFFSFNEASDIFDKVMEDKQLIQKPILSPSDQVVLKRLYRKLARMFHPDMQGGNAAIMMQINYAYSQGDLAMLEDIERSNAPKYVDTHTLFGLTMRLAYVNQVLVTAKDELKSIRSSEMYKMFKSKTSLDKLAQSLSAQIERKKQQINIMKSRFEAAEE